jgi:hypothetical protein
VGELVGLTVGEFVGFKVGGYALQGILADCFHCEESKLFGRVLNN